MFLLHPVNKDKFQFISLLMIFALIDLGWALSCKFCQLGDRLMAGVRMVSLMRLGLGRLLARRQGILSLSPSRRLV